MKSIVLFILLIFSIGTFAESEGIGIKKDKVYFVYMGPTSGNSVMGHVGIIVRNRYYSFVNASLSFIQKRIEGFGGDFSIYEDNLFEERMRGADSDSFMILEKRKLSFFREVLTKTNRDISLFELKITESEIQSLWERLRQEFWVERKYHQVRFYHPLFKNCITELNRVINQSLGMQFKLSRLSPKRAFKKVIKKFKHLGGNFIFLPSLQRARRENKIEDKGLLGYLEFIGGVSSTKGRSDSESWRLVYTEELSGAGIFIKPLGGVANLVTTTAQAMWGVVSLDGKDIKHGGKSMLTSLTDIFFFSTDYTQYNESHLEEKEEELKSLDREYVNEVLKWLK